MSVRTRLLLRLVILITGLTAVVAFGQFIVLRGYLYDRVASQSLGALDEAYLGVPQVAPSSSPVNGDIPPDAPLTGQGWVDMTNRLHAVGLGLASVAATGSATGTEPPSLYKGAANPASPPADLVTNLLAAGPGERRAVDLSGGRAMAVVSRLPSNQDVVVFADLADEDAALHHGLVADLLGGLGVLLVAVVAFRPSVAGALRPLRNVAATADAIAAGDVHRRAQLPSSRDEIGHLGRAFDGMVDRLEASLVEQARLIDELRVRDESMRRFLGDASHELRTPLTAIRGTSQVLLGDGLDDADRQEALGHIKTESERMGRLVDDLLVLLRVEGRLPSRPRCAVDLGWLVADGRRSWEVLAEGHPLDVSVQPAVVLGDADELHRLVANLVANAGRHTPEDTPVSVAVEARGDQAEIRVRDQGPGIPEHERALVFERFHRGDPAWARTTGGSGLGLAIVRAIAVEHGGDARIEDSPTGLTVLVRLPLAAVSV
jgi:two-component system, OmpR family, sensor kinase